MKAVLKISIVLSLFDVAAYFSSFYVMPSVAKVTLPKSCTRIQEITLNGLRHNGISSNEVYKTEIAKILM